jgi:hypothetical protein
MIYFFGCWGLLPKNLSCLITTGAFETLPFSNKGYLRQAWTWPDQTVPAAGQQWAGRPDTAKECQNTLCFAFEVTKVNDACRLRSGKKRDLNATVKRILTCHPQGSARGPLKKQVKVLCLNLSFAHLLYSVQCINM